MDDAELCAERAAQEIERGSRDYHAEILQRAGLVTVEEARQIARRYNASHFRNYSDMGERARYSIPADPGRDDDIRLDAFINRAEKAFKDLDRLSRIRDQGAELAELVDVLRSMLSTVSSESREPGAEHLEARAALLDDVIDLLSHSGADHDPGVNP